MSMGINIIIIMKLRKVVFQLGVPDGFIPDQTEDECLEEKERTRERIGAFHCWVNGVVYSPELGKDAPGTLGLVEDIESGIVYEISPELIRFCVPCEFCEPINDKNNEPNKN